MVDDPAAAEQARELLRELHHHVATISHKLDRVHGLPRRTSVRGMTMHRRKVAGLNRELCEARRLIDGLRTRFPDVAESRG